MSRMRLSQEQVWLELRPDLLDPSQGPLLWPVTLLEGDETRYRPIEASGAELYTVEQAREQLLAHGCTLDALETMLAHVRRHGE